MNKRTTNRITCNRCRRNLFLSEGQLLHCCNSDVLCPDNLSKKLPGPRSAEEKRSMATNAAKVIAEGVAALARLKAKGLVR